MFGVSVVTTPGKRSPLLNPGSLAELHQKCHSILPIWLDGAQLSYQNVSHPKHVLFVDSILSQLRPTGVRCGVSLSRDVGNKMLRSPFFSIDLNPYTLSSNIHVQYYVLPSLCVEWKGQTMPITTQYSTVWKQLWQDHRSAEDGVATDGIKAGQNTMTIDWYGQSSTVSLNIYNGGLLAGHATASYLQSVTAAITLGTECLLKWKQGSWQTKTAVAARYARKQMALAATYSLSTGDMDMTYWRHVSPHVQLGTSVVYSANNGKSISSVFFQRELQSATVRGKFDSDTSMGCMYERTRSNGWFTYGLSLLWCIRTNRFICGFKINIEPSNS